MEALVGIGIAIVGGAISAIGQANKNKAEQDKAERMRPVYEAQQAAIQAQLAQIKEERIQAGELSTIQRQNLAIQGTNVAMAGREAKGQVATTAAVGNIGGASVLRKAESVQSKLDSQMAFVAGEGKKLDINYQQQLTSLDVAEKGANANLLQSQVNEANNETDIQFLQDYGWMTVASQGINAAATATKIASGVDWAGGNTGIDVPKDNSFSPSYFSAMQSNYDPYQSNYGTSLALENYQSAYSFGMK